MVLIAILKFCLKNLIEFTENLHNRYEEARPHLCMDEEARPHLCMDEWNRPTTILKRLSLTQAARDKLIPTGLAPVLGTKTHSLEAFSQYSTFYL